MVLKNVRAEIHSRNLDKEKAYRHTDAKGNLLEEETKEERREDDAEENEEEPVWGFGSIDSLLDLPDETDILKQEEFVEPTVTKKVGKKKKKKSSTKKKASKKTNL